MNNRRLPAKRVCLALVAPLLAAVVSGQTSAPAGATDDKEVITLSEFQVDATKDKGYHASNSVSGSRFDTPIKDLPFALQAFTQEFINDIHPSTLYDVA